ncbi:MAG: hypothetical protein U9Q85_04665, partial [Patescibacteria group bacterium]|nr:hypothetical protein [Patescibacteria group bacterium]
QISEETIKAVNDRIMAEARRLKLTKGKKMRVDSTVTEANIHYPTDSSLIVDGVRKINKTLVKLNIVPKGYRNFKRKIKQQINIIRTIGRKNKEVRQKAIQEFVKMGKTVINKTKGFRRKQVSKIRKILEKIISQTDIVNSGKQYKSRKTNILSLTGK